MQTNKGKQFFFEKKNQKTFIPWLLQRVGAISNDRCVTNERNKSFLVLFFKKGLLALLPLGDGDPRHVDPPLEMRHR